MATSQIWTETLWTQIQIRFQLLDLDPLAFDQSEKIRPRSKYRRSCGSGSKTSLKRICHTLYYFTKFQYNFFFQLKSKKHQKSQLNQFHIRNFKNKVNLKKLQ